MDSSGSLIVKSIYPDYLMILNGHPPLYKCTICRKTFKSKSNIAYHRNCDDNSEKPFSCEVCSRKFSSKTHLRYHILTHTGEKPFNCDDCDKSFKTKTKLRRHRETHSKTNKEYSCKECGKLFLRIASLKVHQQYHVRGKSFRCDHCGNRFHAETNLKRHIAAIHSDKKQFACDKCHKSFALKWSLKLHKRTHTGEQLISCSKCHSKMIQSNLRRHMETHKDIIKLVCSICEKEFTRKDNLQRHVTHMHLENGINAQVVPEVIPRGDSQMRAERQETIVSVENLYNETTSNFVPTRKESVIQYSKKLQPTNRVSVIRKVQKENTCVDKSDNQNSSSNSESQKALEYPNAFSYQEYENNEFNQCDRGDESHNTNIEVLFVDCERLENETFNQTVSVVNRANEGTSASHIHVSVSVEETVYLSKIDSLKAVDANETISEESYHSINNLLDLSMKPNHI